MTHEKVFISHASDDDTFVTRLHDALEAASLDVWVDHKDIKAGDNFSKTIQTVLQNRNYCIFVLSPNSAENENCEAEWWSYLNQPHRRLYVVLAAPIDKKIFPWRLTMVQYVDLSADFDSGLQTLITAITDRRAVRDIDAGVRVERRISGRFPYGHFDIPMTGRDADLAAVKSHLLNQNRRLLVLTAVGGAGKTRLAVELAAKTTEFSEGVVWLTLNSVNTESDVTAALRDHLNLSPTDSPDSVWDALSRVRLLLVLDNAESVPVGHRIAIANRLKDYPIDGGTRVLMTSREHWKECRVFNLAYPMEGLSLDAAEQILRDMAKFKGLEQKLKGREHEFAEKAHCHPRIIQYAVSWLDNETLTTVIKMLENHTGEDMQQVLEDVLHSTLRQIEERSGETVIADFKRLLVCKGGFTEEAANALIGEDSPSLGILRRWNLLGQTSDRYSIDPLAEAVLEVTETAHPVHFDFYEALARQHHEIQDYLGLDIESDNLTAVFDWAMRAGEYEKAYLFCSACAYFLGNRGRFNLRKLWFESVAEKLETHPDERLKARVQSNLGNVYKDLAAIEGRPNNLRRAIDCYQAALDYHTPQAAPLDYETIQNNLGNTYGDLSEIEDRADNLQRAIQCFQKALEYRTPQTAPLDYAMTQNNLGVAYQTLSDREDHTDNLHRAITCYQAALEYYTPQAAPLHYAMTQNNLGAAYRDLAAIEDRADNLRRAIACYEAALEYRTPQSAPLDYAQTQQNLGLLYQDLGETEKQCMAWHEAEKYFRLMGYVDNADLFVRALAELGC